MTYLGQYQEAKACKDRPEAQRWLEKEILRYAQEHHRPGPAARWMILQNLKAMARMESKTAEERIKRLFEAEEPDPVKPE